MSTIVFFHAHPDDEASQTSGTMTLASRRGHRVVCVYATNGDHGEVPDDLAADETLIDRRRREAAASARVTGTARIAWLDYADSGMTGWEENEGEDSFHVADTGEAAARLAAILDEEGADVLVTYDWHGGYGHPDHVKAHHVAHAAADLTASRPRLVESTLNRDHLRTVFAAAAGLAPEDAPEAPTTDPEASVTHREVSTTDPEGPAADPETPGSAHRQTVADAGGIATAARRMDVDGPADDGNPVGTPESEIHWAVALGDAVEAKRAALACHASQVTDIGMFLSIPPEHFAVVFGHEYFIEPGLAPGLRYAWPFDPTP